MSDKSKLNNFVAVKYHVRTLFSEDTIALHNFYNGYCGISKIEGDRYCLCYLTTADNLQRCNGSIAGMQEKVLMKNPHLKKYSANRRYCMMRRWPFRKLVLTKKSRWKEMC